MRTRHNHRDKVEPALVTLAKELGGSWIEEGPLDGWLWHPRRGAWFLVEIKDPAREGQKNEYTPKQRRFITFCRDTLIPVLIWRTRADVLRDFGVKIAVGK